jgi:hypothetical protein
MRAPPLGCQQPPRASNIAHLATPYGLAVHVNKGLPYTSAPTITALRNVRVRLGDGREFPYFAGDLWTLASGTLGRPAEGLGRKGVGVKARWAVTAQPRHGLHYEAGRLRVRPILLVAPPFVAVVAALAVWMAFAVQSNPIAPAALALPQAPAAPVPTTTLPAPTQWPLPIDLPPPWLPIPTDEFNPMPAPPPQAPGAPQGPAPKIIPPDAPLPSKTTPLPTPTAPQPTTPLPTPTAPQPTAPPADYCDPRVDLCVH